MDAGGTLVAAILAVRGPVGPSDDQVSILPGSFQFEKTEFTGSISAKTPPGRLPARRSARLSPLDPRRPVQKLSFKPNCMMRAGSVPLIWPAGAVPIVAFGLLKFARLKELNISQRMLSFARSAT